MDILQNHTVPAEQELKFFGGYVNAVTVKRLLMGQKTCLSYWLSNSVIKDFYFKVYVGSWRRLLNDALIKVIFALNFLIN